MRVNFDTRTFNFNFIGVHGGISDHDNRVLYPLRLSGPDLKIYNEAVVEIGICELPASLLYDLDVVQIRLWSEPQYCLNC